MSGKLIVIGVGNTLRQDDGAAVYLVDRLLDSRGAETECIHVYGPDISLAPEIAQYEQLLVLDAMVIEDGEPYKFLPLQAGDDFVPGGFTSHLFQWSNILAMAGEVYDHCPQAHVLGISARCFGIETKVSDTCRANADQAFDFLIRHYPELAIHSAVNESNIGSDSR
ncbi:MAG: hydrogenase maturation protease [bacterium]|nr:hydrogenase maturation protease [bacterium]